jgi:ABC-type amino acid transport substrate-binding protein
MLSSLLLAVGSSSPLTNVSWAHGAVCAETNASSVLAGDLLRGKRLRVLDLDFPPYATPDPTATHGWAGMDVDMLEAICGLLGCTFEIVNIGVPSAGVSWTDFILANHHRGDLTASSWVHSPARLQRFDFLRGHLDQSTVLIARRDPGIQNSGSFAIFRPYTVCAARAP